MCQVVAACLPGRRRVGCGTQAQPCWRLLQREQPPVAKDIRCQHQLRGRSTRWGAPPGRPEASRTHPACISKGIQQGRGAASDMRSLDPACGTSIRATFYVDTVRLNCSGHNSGAGVLCSARGDTPHTAPSDAPLMATPRRQPIPATCSRAVQQQCSPARWAGQQAVQLQAAQGIQAAGALQAEQLHLKLIGICCASASATSGPRQAGQRLQLVRGCTPDRTWRGSGCRCRGCTGRQGARCMSRYWWMAWLCLSSCVWAPALCGIRLPTHIARPGAQQRHTHACAHRQSSNAASTPPVHLRAAWATPAAAAQRAGWSSRRLAAAVKAPGGCCSCSQWGSSWPRCCT